MGAVILDTNVVSIAHLPEPPAWIISWFRRLGPEAVATSWVTVYEIEYGIRMCERSNPETASFVLNWFEKFLNKRMHFLEMNLQASRILGEMAACSHLRQLFETQPRINKWGQELKNETIKLGADAMIAAMSIAYGLPIASMNVKDFVLIDRHFPLPGLYNPQLDEWVLGPPIGWGMNNNANDDHTVGQTDELVATSVKA
ncbi:MULTISPECIES: type II toxin-antitoxin system VapC family toxin [unclassified Rhizobium]|uniref:type II toxin-antitoxin system VapC family toxin n=1 Tax=unclassified Rhizobium TaxID=2613769 RepID=UPI001ADAF186|nr:MULTISPECIES: type II toxin-antitoxin system VapC family toxin [unclassified Rhizobium]MBO9126924.1 type II toxin-antitoxin system VapC family toxin [Rhizobium sp. 16-488-2b]MBO9177372.1 type II toxin-antitoxin system VapC family toxin [Rhizobium sp. 16-488-2a]